MFHPLYHPCNFHFLSPLSFYCYCPLDYIPFVCKVLSNPTQNKKRTALTACSLTKWWLQEHGIFHLQDGNPLKWLLYLNSFKRSWRCFWAKEKKHLFPKQNKLFKQISWLFHLPNRGNMLKSRQGSTDLQPSCCKISKMKLYRNYTLPLKAETLKTNMLY